MGCPRPMDYGSMGPASKKAGPWRTLDRMHQGVLAWYPGETYQQDWQRQRQIDYAYRTVNQLIGGVIVTPGMRVTLDRNDAYDPRY
jgi:hypothetical protein